MSETNPWGRACTKFALAAARLILAVSLFAQAVAAAEIPSETGRACRYSLITLVGFCFYLGLSVVETVYAGFRELDESHYLRQKEGRP